MKILIVCSGNAENFDFKIHQAFVYEQIEAVKDIFEIEYQTFFIKGKGFSGYLKNLVALKKEINNYLPDIVHAHFGLSGLLACLQRRKPVIITFHGSDANIFSVKVFSKFAAKVSKYNIFVSERIKDKIESSGRFAVIPCGIDLQTFYPVNMKIAREKLFLDQDKKYILFSSSFDNPVKNSQLAFSAISLLNTDCELIELKNKSRSEVNLLLNACNLLLLTSISEGSPQIIKEAMACNCPIVATDVGDIRKVMGNVEGCYIASNEPVEIAEKIKLVLKYSKRTNGRVNINCYDNKIIAGKVFDIYKMVTRTKE